MRHHHQHAHAVTCRLGLRLPYHYHAGSARLQCQADAALRVFCGRELSQPVLVRASRKNLHKLICTSWHRGHSQPIACEPTDQFCLSFNYHRLCEQIRMHMCKIMLVVVALLFFLCPLRSPPSLLNSPLSQLSHLYKATTDRRHVHKHPVGKECPGLRSYSADSRLFSDGSGTPLFWQGVCMGKRKRVLADLTGWIRCHTRIRKPCERASFEPASSVHIHVSKLTNHGTSIWTLPIRSSTSPRPLTSWTRSC